MTIVFLCGSLEPAKDGVGDYTRRLAAELFRLGHGVAAIAINDRHITRVLVEDQDSDGVKIRVYRLPSYLKKERTVKILLGRWISTIDPDWVSLQYVPFSFQKYGMPLKLGELLRTIGEDRKWHIMFHELWVGMEKEASLKLKIWGEVQKFIAKRLIWQLAPKRIHTQATLYQNQLAGLGCYVDILPLFGNIPQGGSIKVKTSISHLKFVIFGEIQPKAPFSEFLNDLHAHTCNNKRKVKFIFVGWNGKELDSWLRLCEYNDFESQVLGELIPEKLSEILKECDWGISTTPFYQIEKSGTVAAMREHCLPVYCIARKWTLRRGASPSIPDFVREYKSKKLNLKPPIVEYEKSGNLQEIGESFINSLSKF